MQDDTPANCKDFNLSWCGTIIDVVANTHRGEYGKTRKMKRAQFEDFGKTGGSKTKKKISRAQ